ncbi:MBL fold metallo-hydrolase [Mogibacterium timidum]
MSIIFTKIEAAPIGENTYVIKDESTGKCAVIDPGCMTASINRFIYDGSGLKYILLTHAHWDHIAALNEYVSKYPDARVVASFDEREMLIDSSINHSARYTESAISREADIYVSDNEELSLGNSKLRFIATPGHTKGGMCILVDDKLFSGDTLFLRSVGRTDLYGGSWQDLKASIQDKLFKLDGSTKVYPGHGPSTTIELEMRENPFV